MLLKKHKTFTSGIDYRGHLDTFLKSNCLSLVDFEISEKKRPHIIERLSLGLVDRSGKHGLAKSKLISDIIYCGKEGECQKQKVSGEERYCVHNCQARKFHIPCAIRYRAGQGQEDHNQFMEIIASMKLWGFYKWVFTIPDESRAWIDKNPGESKEFLKDTRIAIARTMKSIFGINTKVRQLLPGFKILYHPSSSGNPFIQSSHFHVMALPLLCDLKEGKTETFPKIIDEQIVKQTYKKNLDKVFKKYSLTGCTKDIYNVRLEYVEKNLTSSVIHSFKYNNRSMTQDVLKTIKRVKLPDYTDFVCVTTDKKKNESTISLKSFDDILEALEFILNPPLTFRMAYGYLNRLDKYSLLLGIEPDEYENDENWETQYEIDIRRTYKTVFIEETKTLKTITKIWKRRKGIDEPWSEITPEALRGERVAMGGRKLYKCKNAKKQKFNKGGKNNGK